MPARVCSTPRCAAFGTRDALRDGESRSPSDSRGNHTPGYVPGAGKSPSGSSPRSSTRWSQGYLLSIPGRNLDGNVDCDSARTLGRNLTRYSARNRTRNSSRCSRGSGRSSGEGNRRSSPHRSSGDSLGRDFGDHGDSYGGGIGGVGKGIGTRVLVLGKLGPFP